MSSELETTVIQYRAQGFHHVVETDPPTFCNVIKRTTMYPIDFSEGRRSKKKKGVQIPQLPSYSWAVLGGAAALMFVAVAGFDYSSLSHADSIIDKMEATMESKGSSKEIRQVAGVSPERKTRSSELHETYTFDRVLPLPPRTATVVYSSSGRITRILRDGE